MKNGLQIWAKATNSHFEIIPGKRKKARHLIQHQEPPFAGATVVRKAEELTHTRVVYAEQLGWWKGKPPQGIAVIAKIEIVVSGAIDKKRSASKCGALQK